MNYWTRPKPDHMTDEVVKKLPDWLKSFCVKSRVEKLCVSFLGGEPSIRMDLCLNLMESIYSKLNEVVRPYHGSWFMFFTNGDFLTDEALIEMSRYNTIVLYNPTYDSLEEIDRKLKLIKKRIRFCCMSVVIDGVNIGRLIEITDIALSNKVNLRLNPLYHPTSDYIHSLYEPLDSLFDHLISTDELIWPKLLLGSLYVGWGSRSISPYSYGSWLLVVDTDGSIRICSADDGTDIGDLSTISSIDDVKFDHSWNAKSIGLCQRCEWLSWCHGGHPLTRFSYYGSYNYPTPYCDLYKKLFPKWKSLLDKWESRKHGQMYM